MAQNNSKIGFGGTVHVINLATRKEIRRQATPGNPELRPLIKHLKHNCGSKDNEFAIIVHDKFTALVANNFKHKDSLTNISISTPKGPKKDSNAVLSVFADEFMQKIREGQQQKKSQSQTGLFAWFKNLIK